MMFDTTYNIGTPTIQIMQDENGAAYEAQFVAPVNAIVPVSPQQAALVPMGAIRFNVDKITAANIAAGFQEASEALKARPQVQTAATMSEADALAEMAKQAQHLRGPRG